MRGREKQKLGRLFAVDPSLTASGWTLFEIESENPLRAGVLKPPGTTLALADRLVDLQHQVEQLFELYQLSSNDILICEGPAPLVKNPDSATKVEQVRSLFETLARSRGVQVPGRINPRTVQTELLGMKGQQLLRKDVKLWARETAAQLFGDKLAEACQLQKDKIPQDIVDSALVGSYAISVLRQALSGARPLSEVFRPGQKKSWGYGRSGSKRASWSEADLRKVKSK